MSKSARTIINVVSGKGGTGKTLMACVLADMLGVVADADTVVVDLDVFVRGLTSLLYFHRNEELRIADENQLVASTFFREKVRHRSRSLALSRYRSFHVVPAVSTINELLNYQDLAPNTRDEARAIVGALLSSIPREFRFVILDSRAGYDELIAATHELSDVSVCVEEQDPISRVTSDNLVAQLMADSDTPLFRLVNKARGISSMEAVEGHSRSVTDLGVIPFDMDIMSSFGQDDFWDVVGRSLYRSALAKVWNRLSTKMQLTVQLREARLSPVASERVEVFLGHLGGIERILVAYGIILAFVGLTWSMAGNPLQLFKADPSRAAAFLVGLLGAGLAISASLRMRGK